MLRQIAFGATVSLANIAVHAVAMIVVIRVARSVAAKWLPFPTVRPATVMVGTVAVLMAAHMTEIVITLSWTWRLKALIRCTSLSSISRPWDTATSFPFRIGACSDR